MSIPLHKKLRCMAVDQRNLANRLVALAKILDRQSPDGYTHVVLTECSADARRIADRLATQANSHAPRTP